MARGFFEHIDFKPYFGDDESLANISISLAERQRLGDLVFPFVNESTNRNRDYFIYGPFYFYTGATMTWLFGDSATVQRVIYLLGTFSIALLGAVSIRRYSWLGVVLFPAAFFGIVWLSQWPMIRPDIMTGVFAAGFLACLSHPGAWRQARAWFLAGFCASAGVISHPIAWGLVPICAVLWFAFAAHGVFSKAASTRHLLFSLLAVVGGGLLPAIIHLAHMGIDRIPDLIKYYGFYIEVTDTFVTKQSFTARLSEDFRFSTAGVPFYILYLNVSLIIGAFSVLLIDVFSGFKAFSGYTKPLLAPVCLVFIYPMAQAIYPNCCHVGYFIVIQVGAVWTAITFVVLLPTLVRHCLSERRRVYAHITGGALSVVTIALFLVVSTKIYQAPPRFSPDGGRTTSISRMINEVKSMLPARATVWGEGIFGLQSATGLQVVSFGNALLSQPHFTKEVRSKFAPQYLVLGHTYLPHFLRSHLVFPEPGTHLLNLLATYFPEYSYKTIAIVHAEPYGQTRIMKRFKNETAKRNATVVRVKSPLSWQWLDRGEAVNTPQHDLANIAYRFIWHSGQQKVVEAPAKVYQLPKGLYRFVIDIKNTNPDISGTVIVSGTDVIDDRVEDLPPDIGIAPYSYGTSSITLTFNHKGGAVFIAQLDKYLQADFDLVKVVKYGEEIDLGSLDKLEVPHLSSWTAGNKRIQIERIKDDQIRVVGDQSKWGYQLLSPWIDVDKNQILRIQAKLEVESGRLGLGILNEDGNWLRSPAMLKNNATILHPAGNSRIRIVLANDNSEDPVEMSKFRFVLPIIEQARAKPLYADRLVECIDFHGPFKPDRCE